MSEFTLNAETRVLLGKGASRRLRHADKVPAVIFGGEEAPQSLTLEHRQVAKLANQEAFYSSIVTINIDGKPTQAILKDMQRHAYKPKVTHLDFQRVDANAALHTSVPLHFINAENSDAVKLSGANISHNLNEVEIKCLPANLPEFIEVDLSAIAVGQILHLSDLVLPEGVELAQPISADNDQPIAAAHKAKGAVDDAEGEEAAAE